MCFPGIAAIVPRQPDRIENMLRTIWIRIIKIAALYGGAATGISFLVIFGQQIISWLKTDNWTHVPILDPHVIQIQWLGALKIARWLADLPLTLFLLFVTSACIGLFVWAEGQELADKR